MVLSLSLSLSPSVEPRESHKFHSLKSTYLSGDKETRRPAK